MQNSYLVRSSRCKSFISNFENHEVSHTDIFNTISPILWKIFVSARILAKLAGQLISIKYVVGDIVQLKTRFLHKSVEQKLLLRQNI